MRIKRFSWILRAFLLLAVSGGLLINAFLVYYLQGRWPQGIQTKTWQGDEFVVFKGKGVKKGEALILEGTDAHHQAIALVSKFSLLARDFPYMEIDINPWPDGVKIDLIWRTAERSHAFHRLPLTRKANFLKLANIPGWQGTVTDIGFFMRGPLISPLVLHAVSLQPLSPIPLLRGIWEEWTTFEGWSLRSINFIGNPDESISPVVASAAWIGTAWLLYFGLLLLGKTSWDLRTAAAIFLLGWLALDARWQWDLGRKIEITHAQYAGKTPEEKRLAERDGILYAFIQEVKKRLPRKPCRIFVITPYPHKQDRYLRLKAHYYLLPHNVHSSLSHPPKAEMVQSGDYLLIFRRIPGAHYDSQTEELHWKNNHLPVERIFSSPLGSLYEVR